MNSRVDGNNINSESAANALMGQIKFSGLTPLGTALQQKIMEPLVLGPARAGRLQKPVLIIAVTDGAPGGEDRFTVVKVIKAANQELARTRYGSDAISFQFAQVGNDMGARKFLEEIDKHVSLGSTGSRAGRIRHSTRLRRAAPRTVADIDGAITQPEIGGLVDTTSNYENEADDSELQLPPLPIPSFGVRSLALVTDLSFSFPLAVLKSNPPYDIALPTFVSKPRANLSPFAASISLPSFGSSSFLWEVFRPSTTPRM